jgi:hypothetical protein
VVGGWCAALATRIAVTRMGSEALNQQQIRDLVSRAGITGAGSGSPEDLVLVFCGRWRETLDAYDEHGRLVGAAVRVEGRNKQAGHRYRYEFAYERPDGRADCALRDVTGHQAGIHQSPDMFSVLGPDGAELASIVGVGRDAPTIWGLPRPNELEVACSRVVAGHFRPAAQPDVKPGGSLLSKRLRAADRPSSRVWYLQDEAGRDLARITHLQRQRPDNAYVVEIDPNVTEPLRTIAPTFCVIADNLFIDRSRPPIGRG